jgi:hypothetical protein
LRGRRCVPRRTSGAVWQEAKILADATGWTQKDIEARMSANGQSVTGSK